MSESTMADPPDTDPGPPSASSAGHRPPPFDVVAAALDGVEGWLTLDQARMLYDAARAVPAGGRIVEIGSFRGRSTTVLGLAAAPGVEVVAIDPHAGNDRGPGELEGFAAEAASDHEAFRANLARAGVLERVRHVRAFSQEALGSVTGEVDVLFVDGAHRYAPARDDLARWGARVRPGGLLLVHDAFSSVGVTLAIGRTLLASPRFRYVGRAGSLAAYAAVAAGERVSTAERVVNAGRQLGQLPWFVRNLLMKVLIRVGLGRATRLLGRPEPAWPY